MTQGAVRRTEFEGDQAEQDDGCAFLPTFLPTFLTAFLPAESFDAGDVGHLGLLLEGNQFVHEFPLPLVRQP